MEEEKSFLQWYRNKVQENAQDPPEEVWENITDQLDINDVWDKVSGKLDETDKAIGGRTKIYYTALLLLVLAIIAGLIGFEKYGDSFFVKEDVQLVTTSKASKTVEKKYQDTLIQKSIVNPLNRSGKVSTEENQKTDDSLKQPYTSSSTVSKIPLTTGQNEQKGVGKNYGSSKGGEVKGISFTPGDQPLVQDSANVFNSNTETISLVKRRFPSTAFRLPNPKLLVMDSMIGAVNLTVPIDSNKTAVAQEEDDKDKYRKSVKVGLTASVKNTWLLNKTTYSGLEKHTLNTTVPDFGKDIGVLLDYDFSERLAFQAEVVLAEMGQKYEEYLNGKYVTREINLTYYNVHLLLKYKLNPFLGETGSNIIIGSYGSTIKTAHEIIGDNAIDQKNRFTNHDFGAVLGYELNREVLKNLFFSSGLRLNYGFTNIHKNKMEVTSTGSLALIFP